MSAVDSQNNTYHLDHVGWIEAPAGDVVFQYLREGWFETLERSFLWAYLRPDSSFLDVGSHVGLHAATARRVAPDGRVVCVEPNKALHPYLHTNVADFELIDTALSRQVGKAIFESVGDTHTSFGHIVAESAAQPSSTTVEVAVTTLDEMMRERAEFVPDVIKVDVEGDELNFFEGGRRWLANFEGVIVMEFSKENLERNGASTEQLQRVAEQAGFRLTKYDVLTNQVELCTPTHPVWYQNFFLCKDVNAVNKRLATASENNLAVAADIAAKGAEAKSLLEHRVALEKRDGVVSDMAAKAGLLVDKLRKAGADQEDSSAEAGSSSPIAVLQEQLGVLAGLAEFLDKRIEVEATALATVSDNLVELQNEHAKMAWELGLTEGFPDVQKNHETLANSVLDLSGKLRREATLLSQLSARSNQQGREAIAKIQTVENLFVEFESLRNQLTNLVEEKEQRYVELSKAYAAVEQRVFQIDAEKELLNTEIEEKNAILWDQGERLKRLETENQQLPILLQQSVELEQCQHALEIANSEVERLRGELDTALRRLQLRNLTTSEKLSQGINDLLELRKSRLVRFFGGSRLKTKLDEALDNLSR